MKNYDGWLEIVDLDKFVDYLRNVVYINFKEDDTDDQEIDLYEALPQLTDEETKELERVLDKKECLIIVSELSKKIRHKKTKQLKYLINDMMLYKILDNLNKRLASNIVANLVKNGYLESAFDNEKNDFIFWTKDIEDDNKTGEL